MYNRTKGQKYYYDKLVWQSEHWEYHRQKRELVDKGIVEISPSKDKEFIHIRVNGFSVGCWFAGRKPNHQLINAVFDTAIYITKGAKK